MAARFAVPDRGGVDVLLFDLGRVVVDIDFERVFARWAAMAGCDPAAIRERFSHDEPYCRHEVGHIDAAQYFDCLRRSLAIDLSNAQFIDGWNAVFIGEMPGIANLLAWLEPRIPL